MVPPLISVLLTQDIDKADEFIGGKIKNAHIIPIMIKKIDIITTITTSRMSANSSREIRIKYSDIGILIVPISKVMKLIIAPP